MKNEEKLANAVCKLEDKVESQLRTEWEKYYQQFKNQEVIIFGGGPTGRWMLKWFIELGYEKIVAVADNNSSLWGKYIEGVKCENIVEIEKMYPDALVIICSTWYDEIGTQLHEHTKLQVLSQPSYIQDVENMLRFKKSGWKEKDWPTNYWRCFPWYLELEASGDLENMLGKLESYVEDEISKNLIRSRVEFFLTGDLSCVKNMPRTEKEYFSEEYYHISEDEVFVDCGAYIGDTISSFVSYAGSYKTIYALEPDTQNFSRLEKYVKEKNLPDVKLLQMATGDKNEEVLFDETGLMGAHITEEGKTSVWVRRLDDLEMDDATFIKMDVEGAELATLQGAEKLIKRNTPKLAICLYHKPEDLFDIPMYLKSIVPEYKFKIRHHGSFLHDTILYAYVE